MKSNKTTGKPVFNISLLEKLMEECGHNGSEVARLTRMSRANVSRIRKGQRKRPEVDFLLALTEVYPGHTIEDFRVPEASLKSDTLTRTLERKSA